MKLVKLFSLVIVGLIITNVTLTNRAVDQSVTVSEYNQAIEDLDHGNTLLSAQIADLGSLTKLREGIEAAGFVSAPTVVSLGGAASVASR